MHNHGAGIVEELAPGAVPLDTSWMAAFWAVFTDVVIEVNAQLIVTNLRHKAESNVAGKNIAGHAFLDIAMESDKPLVAAQIEKLQGGLVSYVRFQFLAHWGRYYRWTLEGVWQDREFLGCRGVAIDVTEQTLKEITLNWQRAVIEGSNDFITISDFAGSVLYTNPGAYAMTGFDPSAGSILSGNLFPDHHRERIIQEGFPAILYKQTPWVAQGELIRHDASLLPIEHTMFTVHNEDNEAFLIATIIRNISSFLENERRIAEALKAAEAASLAKSEFLSRMSHEIRTPMNAIIGMINIGLATDDVERKNYCFRRADTASKHLLSLINDILDMSKIEAEMFELSCHTFNFEKTLQNIANLANGRAEEKQQSFTVSIAPEVPSHIHSDELRLSQVISNLLSNAVKFTPEKGSIALRVKLVAEQEETVTLQFDIVDTGIGISPEQQQRLFTSFSQATADISQQFGGTGLGLAISRSIVEMVGGSIWVESELGKGSCFSFTWQVKRAEKKPETELYLSTHPSSLNLRDYTILVVEDVEINREIIAAILEESGVTIDYAINGQEAVAMFQSNSLRYHLILMDINMPILDGYQATQQIRALDLPSAKEIPIIAMTANVFKEDITKCLAAGMNAHTGKPIDAPELYERLKQFLKE
ncbi:MAG: ATP-binding protein [Symbiobacteriaceae bacterium]|nr:ATP-binding protein [Symbiobacteriaceae bacterium]